MSSKITVSAEAERELRRALAKEGAEGSWVRIASSEDACGGLCFELEIVGEPRLGDVVLRERGVRVAAEAKTADRLENARLDYARTAQAGGAFVIRNTGSACTPGTCTCE